MSVNDKILIKIQADITDLSTKLDAIVDKLNGFQREVKNTDTITQQLNVGLRAFSWSTFIGGALNASTAITQLLTSTSNLNRAQYLVKQSTVSVERAEDQLARKTLQLNKEIEKNGNSTEKAIMLRNEIATATEQLANKEERLKLAIDQVNDTYVLFGLNAVNTVFGTIQTLIGLKTMAAQRILANKIALDQERLALDLNSRSAVSNSLAHQGVIASRAGAGVGLASFTGAVSGATGVVGKLTSSLGTAGLVGSLIATGVALGALALDQIKVNEVFDNTKRKLDNLAAGYVNVAEASATMSQVTKNSNVFTMGFTENIDEIKKKIEEAEKALEGFRKDPVGFSRGKSPEEVKKILEPLENLKAALAREEKEFKIFKENLDNIMSGKTYKDISPAVFEIFEKQKNKLIERVEILDRINLKEDEFVKILTEQLQIMVDEKDLTQKQADFMKERILQERQLNNEKKTGNELSKNELKYQKQIAELKKKLSPRFIAEQQRSLFESLKAGEYGLSESYLSLSSDNPEKLGYVPFSGVYNTKTGEVRHNLQNIRTAEKIAKHSFERNELIKSYNYLEKTDPTNPLLPVILDRIQRHEDAIKKIKKEPSITSSYSSGSVGFKILQDWKKIGQNKEEKEKALKSLADIQIKQMIRNQSDSQARAIRDASYKSGLHLRPGLSASDKSKLNSLKSKVGKARGGRRGSRAPLNYMREQKSIIAGLAAQLESEMMFLSAIDEGLEDFVMNQNIYPSVPADLQFPIGYRGHSYKDTPSWVDEYYKHFPGHVARFNKELATVRERSGILAYTSSLGMNLQTIYNTITNPETANDIDDMLRYNARLAQISTGATVI